MKFGEYFRKLRNSKQVTQQQIANAIEKKPMLVSNVENNKNGPFAQDDLEKISAYLKLSDKEKNELFFEAAKASGRFPAHIWEYFVRCEKAFILVETIVQKNLSDEQLTQVIGYVENMN